MILTKNGKGIVAGAALGDIITFAGVKDVSGKVVSGSKNNLNTARACMKALEAISTKHIFGGPKPEVVDAETKKEVTKE